MGKESSFYLLLSKPRDKWADPTGNGPESLTRDWRKGPRINIPHNATRSQSQGQHQCRAVRHALEHSTTVPENRRLPNTWHDTSVEVRWRGTGMAIIIK